jgi:FkbM family methyltransferase
MRFNRLTQRRLVPRSLPPLATIDYGYPEVISTAQNQEDVLLFRAFSGRTKGYYVDIGAGDPNWDSVTNWLSRVGWTGINVEPNPDIFPILAQWRPSDINLNIGCSDQAGTLEFYKVANSTGQGWGLSTLEPASAERAQELGYSVTKINIEVLSLANILDLHATRSDIDVLKVDVEGREAAVLRSGDWRRFRPSLVVVEAVDPMSARPSLSRWAPILLEANYRFALFDGVNGWFIADEAPDAVRSQLTAPVNCNDHFRKACSTDFVLPE